MGLYCYSNVWDVMRLYNNLEDRGMIFTFCSIFYIIWYNELIIGINTLIDVLFVSYVSITRRHHLIYFSTLLYPSQVQPFLHGQ